MNMKEIKEILELMAEHDLSELEIEKEGMKVKLKKTGASLMSAAGHAVPQVVMQNLPATQSAPVPPAVASGAETPGTNFVTVRAPMVGTFYSSPAPDQPPYVTMGSNVKEGDVLCILEAMKLMNEIKAEASGEIAEILVKNGQPIEFDQPLFRIKKV